MRCTLTLAALTLALASMSNAQATRTWVSGVGDDANPCSRTAPCRTFAGALSKTAAGGEMNCLDVGDFGNGGQLTITRAITIDCSGASGSITAPNDAIMIQAGTNDVVTLRNISIHSGNNAILYEGAKALHVENVRISCLNFGVFATASSGTLLLTVDNTTIADGSVGVFAGIGPGSGAAIASINNTRITNNATGIEADNGSRVTVRNSSLFFNSSGVFQTGGATLGSTVTVVNSTLGYSSSAALQSQPNRFTLAFGNTFVNNVLDFQSNGGTIFTGADNNNSGSAPGTANGGTVPKI